LPRTVRQGGKTAGAGCATSARVAPVGRPAEGFTYRRVGDDVVVYHHGRVAATLRGWRAADFLARAGAGDDQLLMARVTGNYRRGNERRSRNHPRNR